MFRLAVSNFRAHKIRVALTVAAIALSVSLVVAVTSGYASAYAAAHLVLSQYLGTTDALITHRSELRAGINEDVITQLRQDPSVEQVTGRLEVDSGLQTADGRLLVGWAAQIIGVERPADKRVEVLNVIDGEWFDESGGNNAVIDQIAAERLGVGVGGEFILPGLGRQLRLRVVGIVQKPAILAQVLQTVYVPLNTLQQFALPDNPQQVSRVLIDLRRGSNEQQFVQRWQEKLAAIDPLLRLRMAGENRRQMDQNLQGLRVLSYLGGSVSLMAAAFIVFSALSMGVAEQQRSLAMLRAIGAFRSQLARLVAYQGIALAVAGIALGIPLGIAWINLLAWLFDAVFGAGAVVSREGVLFATLGSLGTAIVASLLPAISAMRTSALEAMSPLARPASISGVLIAAAAGILLICVDPLILFTPLLGRSAQFYAHFVPGLPCLMLGFFLLAPLVVLLMERLAAPAVAAVFRLRFELLKQQLSGGVWRSAGSAAALMLGLAILIVTQITGNSAIRGWRIPQRFPDMFIFASAGLPLAELEKVAQVEGIRRDEVMAIAMASPQLGASLFAIAGAAIMPDATMFFGVDPDLSMKMMELEFTDGNAADAAAMLKQGQHLIITQEYRQLHGLGVGDKLPLKTRQGVVEFTVAGVVWSPGIDVIASMQDLGRQFDQRTAASLFGSLADAQEYFGVQRIHLFAANLQPGVEREFLVNVLRQRFAAAGMRAGDVRQIKHHIQRALSRLLLLVSTVAYAAMAIASLGVTNTIMASIRSRRWHFGVLRSLGVTRGQLLRLVLAEATLLGIAGIALGLMAGTLMTIDARQFAAALLGWPKVPIVLPWTTLATGTAALMAVSIVASLWPAAHTARAEPLSLLQAGRASV